MVPPPATQPRSRTLRLIAVGFGVCVALAATEVVLRVSGVGVYKPRVHAYNFLLRKGDRYWVFNPEHPPTHTWDGDPYGRLPAGAKMTYTIGSAGLRGEPPAPGRPSVLVVGDSFTFGEGVQLEETFTARLERAFAVRPNVPAFVNAGVPGYGTVEEAARLPSLLDRYEPKAVLLVAIPNDAIPLQEAAGATDLVNAQENDAPPPLRVVELARHVLGRAAADQSVEEWYASYYFGERASRWEDAKKALQSMAAACRERKIPFGVAMFPLLYRLRDRPFARIHGAYEAACAEMGVPFIDLTPALAVESDRALWVHPTDHHPDARAHELAAEALKPFVDGLLR